MTARQPAFSSERDPAGWCAIIAVLFLALCWHRLSIPSKIYFDEVHYVEAARKLLTLTPANAEHPMLGKQILAASIHWLGDKPLYWRLPFAVLGGWGLFALSRLVWFASGRAAATVIAAVLVATNFLWFVQSRIAMLDMAMASLGMTGLWLAISAFRRPDQGRWRLALAGILFGLALGTKWNIAPVIAVPGLIFAGWKLRDCGPRFLIARSGGPVPGMTLIEAALWLGLVPLAVYWGTYWPGFLYPHKPINPFAPIAWHEYMLQLQDSVRKPHPYQSRWYQWVGNWRAIWYLYEAVDGGQRGIVLIGNPFTMLAGLPALLWGLWAGWRNRRWDALLFVGLYALSLGLWAVSSKPIQFYYHYLLPGTFLMVPLALWLDAVWRQQADAETQDWRWWITPVALMGAVGLFAWFYPIISAANLGHDDRAYEFWMWLKSWR